MVFTWCGELGAPVHVFFCLVYYFIVAVFSSVSVLII